MSTIPKEWTVLSMLEWGTEYFRQHNISDPRLSIEWLLAETLDVKRLDLYLKFDRPLSQKELNRIRPLIKRRALHEPLQYIIGYTDFLNARISVTPHVLIPRIETEQLVETALDQHGDRDRLSVIDIGTGSGCIAIALKMEQPDWQVNGIDISMDALEVARKNAADNRTEIHFQKGDILNWKQIDLDKQFDLVISNPPYVLPGEKETLEAQVVEHEPTRALYCDDLGKMYQTIINFSEHNLKEKGWLYLEVHEQHSQPIHSLFGEDHWSAEIKKDYQQKPRFLIARKRF